MLSDPTLFALPNLDDFSGTAWLKPAAFPYQLTNRVEAPRWLFPRMTELASDFRRGLQPDLALMIPIPAETSLLPPQKVEVSVVAPAGRGRPSWRLEGELAGRAVLAAPELEPLQGNLIVTNTVIRLLVGPRGETLSAVPEASSGSSVADQRALSFARGIRFSSLTELPPGSGVVPGPVKVGMIVFEWFSNEPAGRTPLAAGPP
jgi:hypothetical protein